MMEKMPRLWYGQQQNTCACINTYQVIMRKAYTMKTKKFYVVWVGVIPGIYKCWSTCCVQVRNFKGAKYKSFPSFQQAEQAFQSGWTSYFHKDTNSANERIASIDQIEYNSICVDVGTRGNPGPVEYRGVDTRTGEVLFSYGPVCKGTNNLGEFVAIVHALAYLKEAGSVQAVYSDSNTALKWIRDKKVCTSLERNRETEEMWQLVDRSLEWLHMNSYDNKLLKWNTDRWGDIKADYGRK